MGTAKTLYVAGNSEYPNWDMMWAYNVEPNGKLTFQTDSIYFDGGALPVNGLIMDPNSENLLTTYTGFSNAGTLYSNTLEFREFIYLVPWQMHAGGLTYDDARSRVYMTDDGESRLILYNWIPEIPALHNIGYGATEVPLNKPNAGAIAYDSGSEIVYVASKDNGIEMLKTAFDRADWITIGSIGSSYEVQALSVDLRNKYLYTGGRVQDQGPILTRYNLATGGLAELKIAGDAVAVLSLSVDSATSLIYVLLSTHRDSIRTIQVYDPTFHLIQTLQVDGDALQLHVPSTSVGFNPLNTTMTPVSGTVENNGKHTTVPGAEIQYKICMTNTNLFPVTDIMLTDTLPAELEFVRAQDLGDALGAFDSESHTYFYNNASLDPNTTECFSIVTRVKHDVAIGTVFANSVVVDSNETAQSGAGVDVEVGYNALGLTKAVLMDPNHLQVGNTIYVDAGAHVTYRICLANMNNSSAVQNVRVVDELPVQVEFVSADQAGSASGYDEATHSYYWNFDAIEPNYLGCFTITVRMKDDVPPGQLVSNRVLLGGIDSATVTTKADVVVKYGVLSVKLDITDTPGYDPVNKEVVRGSILNYVVDANNVDPMYDAQNVIVTTSIPEGLQFLGVTVGDVNATFHELSRTLTVAQPVVGPGKGIHVEFACLVPDALPGNTVLKTSVVAMANGAPASADSISVTVFASNASVETTLQLWYTGPLMRQDNADEIMIVMMFPEQIRLADIDTTQALVMTPGPSKAFHRDLVEGLITNYFVFAFEGHTRVKGFFDRKPVLDALVPGQESATITVTGKLKTGQSFVGQAIVPVN
ncbi:MAG: hypothetical protein GY809_24980 [Planctomycetes bacterium]|nr:hypothetical protein [Planctomycetota bacterium]